MVGEGIFFQTDSIQFKIEEEKLGRCGIGVGGMVGWSGMVQTMT